MQEILGDDTDRVLRFETGEEVLSSLRKYCADEEIYAASLNAIGATTRILLSWYDMDEKRYSDKKFEGKLEITGLLGNVSLFQGEIIVHAHGTFSDEKMQVFGGHVKELVVGPTCELILHIIPGSLERTADLATGLHLLQ